LKADHEIEKKKIRKVALNFAIEYYKQISKELSMIFTTEAMKILEKYTSLRNTLKTAHSQLKRITHSAAVQETVISELR